MLRKRIVLIVDVLLIAYLCAYLATTTIRSQGTGGLTGPRHVRVFASEEHLMMFYPAYLFERWSRNVSLFDASLDFNVDFRDGRYKRFWLYGDGKHSRIWYDFW